jgi:hypothetical protein
MFQNACTEMAWIIRRIGHSRKIANYFAGFISVIFLPVRALMGRIIVLSKIQNHVSKGSAGISSGARASLLSLPLLFMVN